MRWLLSFRKLKSLKIFETLTLMRWLFFNSSLSLISGIKLLAQSPFSFTFSNWGGKFRVLALYKLFLNFLTGLYRGFNIFSYLKGPTLFQRGRPFFGIPCFFFPRFLFFEVNSSKEWGAFSPFFGGAFQQSSFLARGVFHLGAWEPLYLGI